MSELGRYIGRRLKAGDTLLLQGPIGSGKTHLARAMIHARLNSTEHVPSPTFTLVQTYEPEDGPDLWHADLYRLGDSSELIELGLDEAMERDIVIIEWPDRLPVELRPSDAILIQFELDDEARVLTLSSSSDRAADLMKELADG